MLEKDVLYNLILALNAQGCLCFAQNSDVRHSRGKGRYLPGTPDLVCLLPNGKTVYIEVKRNEKHELSDSQETIAAEIDKRGADFYVVYPENMRRILSKLAKETKGRSSFA